MKLTLVSPGFCSVALTEAGFRPTTSNTPLDELPGFFECSDDSLTELWGYGARSLQLNCIPARTIPPPWQVSDDMGILIDSQRCNSYGWGSNWTDYEVEVQGMIVDGGLCWNVRQVSNRPCFLFVLKSAIDGGHPTLELWYGYYNKPQVTLIPILLSKRELVGVEIAASTWYNIRTVCVSVEWISVYLDGKLLGKFAQGRVTGTGT